MELLPLENNGSPEKFGDKKEAKKKSKKLGSFVAGPSLAEAKKPAEKKEASEQSAFDKMLAELAFKKQEKTEKHEPTETTKKEEKAEDFTEAKEENVEKTAEAPEFETDYSKEIRANELPPSKIFSEGVIDLGRDDELVVALRAERHTEADNEQPVWQSQPEQQHQARVEAPDEPEPSEESREPETFEISSDDTSNYEVTTDEDAEDDESSIPPPHTPTRSQQSSVPPNQPPVLPGRPPRAGHNTPPPQPSNPNIGALISPNVAPTPNINVSPTANPNHVYTTASPNVLSQNPSQEYVTRQQLEDEVYYATAAGQRSGVLSGALVAGGYEHFKHRRREKRMAKEMAKQQKKFEKELKNQQFQHAEQTKKTNETERQVQELQAAKRKNQAVPQPEQQPARVEAVLAAIPNQPAVAERPVERAEAPVFLTNPERTGTAKPEAQPVHAAAPERNRFKANLEKLLPKKPEHALVAKEAEPSERLEIPAEHRIETSAWHSIEVDAKTGKAVENPTFAYGEEYHHERAKETSPRSTTHKQAAGEVALVAAAMSDGGPTGTLPPPTPPADASKQQKTTPTQAITSKVRELIGTGKPAAPTKQATPPLWPFIVALVAVVILLLIAL